MRDIESRPQNERLCLKNSVAGMREDAVNQIGLNGTGVDGKHTGVVMECPVVTARGGRCRFTAQQIFWEKNGKITDNKIETSGTCNLGH